MKKDKVAPANMPTTSTIKIRIMLFAISFDCIGPMNGTMTVNNNPCESPNHAPASAASNNRFEDSSLLDRLTQILPTRNASSHAIGVTQVTPGKPANVTSRTIASHGRTGEEELR